MASLQHPSPVLANDDSDSESDEIDIREDSDGWNDIDEDIEELRIKCLFCDLTLSSIAPLLQHQRAQHDFDLVDTKRRHDLDFYSLIKLVNYVRSSVKDGKAKPDVHEPSLWDDDKFLRPILEDDDLLTCLDDLEEGATAVPASSQIERPRDEPNEATKIQELERQLAKLTEQFAAYRHQVAETLEQRWQSDVQQDHGPSSSSKRAKQLEDRETALNEKYEQGYFDSYATLGIHQIMLQDTVRTDAYRDFVYNNKHLFKDKVVLDVGCGTGVLSMFAAKAGAKRVIAVDASDFIDKARGIAVANSLASDVGGPIVFHKGKVEEITDDVAVTLGLAERKGDNDTSGCVDVLISEWMGYCLLFEAMLPSVLHARDRFLRRTRDGEGPFSGIMAPSHASVHISPLSDPEWTADNVTFWHDVYGFDMSSLLADATEEVLVRTPPKEAVLDHGATACKVFDLCSVTVGDLDFTTPFRSTISGNCEGTLDGFCIWFDICFSPEQSLQPGRQVQSLEVIAKLPGAVHFSTSPTKKSTHWQSGCCVLDGRKHHQAFLKTGGEITGEVAFKRGEEGRDLEISIHWEISGEHGDHGKQRWKMR